MRNSPRRAPQLWMALLAAAAFGAQAQTTAELRESAVTGANVLTIGMGYDAKRYSPLKQITRENVKRLVPVWSLGLSNLSGQEGQPLLYHGVMYVGTHSATIAIDAASGRQLWRNTLEFNSDVPRVVCCGLVNRGLAIYEGKIFRGTLDAYVQALDAKTGKQLWKSKVGDYKIGITMTGAPLIANGVLITGVAGGEFGVRAFLDGWDPDTGKQLWRRYTVAGPEDKKAHKTWPGDSWEHGGGATWNAGSYDPDLDLVYWGTGNPGPWRASMRLGDNLYTCAVLALRPKTGELIWYFQFLPNDTYDYDGINELVQAELTIGGKLRKVVMQANRGGFFYVLDRTNGKLLAANRYVKKMNWADGVDMKTGRPQETALAKEMRASGKETQIWPGVWGGKNWEPMSYSPLTGLAYANTLNGGYNYRWITPVYKAGTFYMGIEPLPWVFEPGPRGFISAIDPLTGKSKWEIPLDPPSFAGTITTAGRLVFTGTMLGEFLAIDADNGTVLWKFQTDSGIISQPISWELNGRQYITVLSGIGGVYHLLSGDERLRNVPTGGSVWTFALFDQP
jgi:alcohol dehydrogenase (cytochrome c)